MTVTIRRARRDDVETIVKMLASAKKFDAERIKADQVARAGGPPDDA